MNASRLALVALLSAGCTDIGGLRTPSAELLSVDLITAPTGVELLAWGCHELLTSSQCALLGIGDPPSDAALRFSFDVVFDLVNENTSLPIPLVEMLLGMTVAETADLGVACVSFCDPDSEECTAARDPEEACQDTAADTGTIPLDDLDDLLELIDDVTSGEVLNTDFRVIPPSESVEAHIQFDIDIDAMLAATQDLQLEALESMLGGGSSDIRIPFTAWGALFFDVPQVGVKNLDFGPWDDTWVITAR